MKENHFIKNVMRLPGLSEVDLVIENVLKEVKKILIPPSGDISTVISVLNI